MEAKSPGVAAAGGDVTLPELISAGEDALVVDGVEAVGIQDDPPRRRVGAK
jgi:hypothetical protein